MTGTMKIIGSSEIWVGEPSGGQDHSQSIVGWVAKATGDASVEFDDAVDRFGAAVAGPSSGEVGQELLLPGAQGPTESRDLGDRAAGERFDHREGDLLALGETFGGDVDRSR